MAQKVRTHVSTRFKVFEQVSNVVCIKHMNTNLDLQTDKIPNKNGNLESNHGLSESTAIDWSCKEKKQKERKKCTL